MIAAASVCLGVILALADALAGKIKFAICGILLSITPLPLAMLLFKIFARLKGLYVIYD